MSALNSIIAMSSSSSGIIGVSHIDGEKEFAIQNACVKVTSKNASGSGFFVADKYILTCAHIVGTEDDEVIISSSKLKGVARVEKITKEEYPDLAILLLVKANNIPKPLPVFADCRPYDICYSFGFSDLNDNDPLILQIEGSTGGISPLLKLGKGQIRPGMSGSPVFNIRTMSVCGIVQETRDRSSDLGGWALPISGVLSKFSFLLKEKKTFDWSLHPFGHYARKFVNQYNDQSLRKEEMPVVEGIFRADLNREYIDLNYFNEKGEQKYSIDKMLHEWGADSSIKYLVILGEYGSGKTSACLKYCYTLLESALQGGDLSTIPLFISYSDVKRARSEGLDIYSFLYSSYRIPIFDNDSLSTLFRQYKITVIFDGLDELAGSLDSYSIRGNLLALAPLLIPAEKVIITCRTTLFPNKDELDYVFPIRADDNKLLHDYLSGEPFQTVFLSDLESCQIKSYLIQKSASKKWDLLDRVRSNYDFMDLARRPLLLSMIAKALSYKNIDDALESFTPAELYGTFTLGWLKYESKRSHLDVNTKLHCLEDLAYFLYGQNVDFICRANLVEFLSERHTNQYIPRIDVVDVEYDFINASFLTRSLDDCFGFSHRSFLEYFAASAILRLVASDKGLAGLDEVRLEGATLKFVADRIDNSPNKLLLIGRLRNWLTKVPEFPSAHFFYSNIVSVLCWIEEPLEGSFLAKKNLQWGDFRNGIFKKCNLEGAVLDGCNLTGADFTEANLQNASLQNAFIHNTCFQRANLSNAVLWNIRIVGGPPSLWQALTLEGGKKIITGSSEGYFYVYKKEGGVWKNILKNKVSDTGILHVSINAKNQYFAITDRDATIKIYPRAVINSTSVKPVYMFKGGHDNIRWTEFSPDGNKLVAACRDNRVRIWEISNHLVVKDVAVHKGPVMCASWNRNGDIVGSIGYDGNVFITPIDGHAPISLLPNNETSAHAGIGRILSFNPVRDILATSGEDGFVKIWDIQNVYFPSMIDKYDANARVFSLAWLSQDKLIVGTEYGDLVLLNTDGNVICWEEAIKAHSDIIRTISVNNSRIDDGFLSASWDGEIKWWTKENMKGWECSTVAESYQYSEIYQKGMREIFKDCDMTGIKGLSYYYKNYFMHSG